MIQREAPGEDCVYKMWRQYNESMETYRTRTNSLAALLTLILLLLPPVYMCGYYAMLDRSLRGRLSMDIGKPAFRIDSRLCELFFEPAYRTDRLIRPGAYPSEETVAELRALREELLRERRARITILGGWQEARVIGDEHESSEDETLVGAEE